MSWTVNSDVRSLFPDADAVKDMDGELINSNWMSSLLRVEWEGTGYYVKRYTSRGRGLRRFFGRSRVRAEWENLQFFADHGLPSANLVAFGEASSERGYFGVLVTQEVGGTMDLAALASEGHPLFQSRRWRLGVIDRLSDTVRTMHGLGFIHTDLKWRNILVETNGEPGVFLIDCPQGRRMPGPFLARGRIKDLACLDKVARQVLSKTERLRFYLRYKRASTLSTSDKHDIRRIVSFFHGRD